MRNAHVFVPVNFKQKNKVGNKQGPENKTYKAEQVKACYNTKESDKRVYITKAFLQRKTEHSLLNHPA